MDKAPDCYVPCLSPMGWCLRRNRCGEDLEKCPFVLGNSKTHKVVRTKSRNAKYAYKIVSIKG